MSDRVPYLYVAGASFSGSTLLAFLLNAHPRMVSVSEVGGVIPHGPITEQTLDSYSCSCGALLLECPFYRELETRVRAAGSSFDLRSWGTHFRASRHRLLDIPLTRHLRFGALERLRDRLVSLVPGYRNTIDEIARRNVHFARATLAISGKQVFVDAQKDPARIKFLSEIEEIDLRVIHLVRDLRGGASSYMRHYPERNDATRAARKWRNANLATERSRRHLPPERWMRLRYDEICEDHGSVVNRIADFVGVERAELPGNFYGVEHHVVGNQMRLGGPGEIRRDDSWKKRLSEDDLSTIAAVAGNTNRFFGFDWP